MIGFKRAVWIGTLGLYNAGHLIGRWYDLNTEDVPTEVEEWLADPRIAAEVAELDEFSRQYEVGDELWCFDHEGFPRGTSEMSPCQAVELHEKIAEIVEDKCAPEEAVLGLIDEVGIEYADSYEYRGEHDSWRDYADELASELLACERAERPKDLYGREYESFAERYFDWEQFARDLQMDGTHTIIRSSNYTTYIWSD